MTGGLRDALAALVERARSEGRAVELRGLLRRTLRDLADAPDSRTAEGVPARFGLVGDSPPMRAVFDLIERAAPSDVPVLVLGETGTGKELVARALHLQSNRADGPLVAVNCAAVPPNLLESELFGHRRGSFTGAVADRVGQIVAADGGTLFLDEIADMPLEMQVKLLRVLEQREVRPVGANELVSVDVRLVAATNRDLASMVEAKAFREDLFYRLCVLRIELPPLRERGADVDHLVHHLAGRVAAEMGRDGLEVSPDALARLRGHPWPGNVRQLENELRRAAALSDGVIGPEDLSSALIGEAP